MKETIFEDGCPSILEEEDSYFLLHTWKALLVFYCCKIYIFLFEIKICSLDEYL